MAKVDIAGKVKKYFAGNQSRKEVHVTSDGFLFEGKQDANAHAKTLKANNVETFSKSGKVSESPVDSAEPTSQKTDAPKVVKFNEEDVPLAKAIEAYNAIEGLRNLNLITGVVKVQAAIDSLEEEAKNAFAENLVVE